MFKKKDRLPAFLFGATDLNANSAWRLFGPTEQRMFVPIAETNKRTVQPIFPRNPPTQRNLDDIQCDQQLPFVNIVFALGGNANEIIAYGHTLFGEVYCWGLRGGTTAENSAYWRNIYRADVTGIGKPIKQIVANGNTCVAVSTDGKVWKLSGKQRTPPEEYTLPAGVVIDRIGSTFRGNSFSYRLWAIDDDGFMYLDHSSLSSTTATMQFYRMSNWVTGLSIDDGGSYPGVANGTRINLTFTAAPAGGLTAAGQAEVNNNTVTALFLTEAGRGYEEPPTVTAGAGGAVITADLFDDGPYSFINGWPIGQSGTAYGTSGFPTVPLGTGWAKVYPESTGAGIGIKENGELWAWNSPLLSNSSKTPAKVADGSWLSAVNFGSGQAAAIRDDYTLWTWGKNYSGLLGNSTDNEASRSSPGQIAEGIEWAMAFGPNVGAYTAFMYAIRKDAVITSAAPAMQYWPDEYFA